MPAICDSGRVQPRTNCAKAQQLRNGMPNESTPISALARMLVRKEIGSISAPARKVSRPLPRSARKLIHSAFAWRCRKLPAATPTRISTSATEMPVQIEMKLAARARAIQTAAMNQMFCRRVASILFRLGRSVLVDLDLLERDESAADHALDHGEEGADFFLAVDDFDHEGQVHRQPENFCGVNAAGGAEAHRPAQDRGPGEARLAGLEHDRFVERAMFKAIAFADEDAQQQGVAGDGIRHSSGAAEHGSGQVSEPDGHEAEDDRENNVDARVEPFSVVGQVDRLHTEGGKNRVATPHP